MVKTGKRLWAQHPHVDNDLSFGEHAADFLKKWFGTWTALGLIIAVIVYWLLFVFDPGELKLNLGLSFLASVQGVILQIAANRGDKKSAELALATHANGEHTRQLVQENKQLTGQVHDLTEQQMTILDQQTQMLTEIKALRAEIGDAKGGEVE